MREITNGSGTFWVDDRGVLQRFVCAPRNSLALPYAPDTRRVFDLHIPRGVRALPGRAFQGFEVARELTFPDSLERMGTECEGAFVRCLLERVVLPGKVWVGRREFAACHVKEMDASGARDDEMMCRIAHSLRFAHCWSLGRSELIGTWPEKYRRMYLGESEPKESWRELHNACGRFWVDSDGVLRDFCCDQAQTDGGALQRLDIPEGVTALQELRHGQGRLSDLSIREGMTLPDSLRSIGSNVFACCELPDVALPAHLETFGDFAFGSSRIRSVTVPAQARGRLLGLGVRQFRDCEVGEIRAPLKHRERLEQECRRWWGDFERGEQTDPVLGPLCCVRARDGMQRGGEIVPWLLWTVANEAMH